MQFRRRNVIGRHNSTSNQCSHIEISPVAGLLGRRSVKLDSAARRARRSFLEVVEPRLVFDGSLVISEFMATNNAADGLRDQDATLQDWIEIRNTTASPLNLAGWRLTDDDDRLDQWFFPQQEIAPGGYLIVFASGKDRSSPGIELHSNFKLGNDGEYLALVAPDGSISSEFAPSFPEQFANISYGRSTDLATQGYFPTATPGAANVGQPGGDPRQRIVINEIMFHPSTENDQHEFIELVNRGTQTVNLQGWQFTAGVSYTFGNVNLAPNQFMVVAANTAAFSARYGNVANLVGGWTGSLSNTGEKIELNDPDGETVDEVEYFDDGDWGRRVEWQDPGRPTVVGWEWESLADGGGRSLELRNWALGNGNGQNWGTSAPINGTPGAQNSLNSTNIAPLISNVNQSVIIPRSTESVTITADIEDELATGLTVSLRWRTSTGSFNTTTMFDDGAHADGAAGDGVYAGIIGAQGNGTIVEYYVEARDSTNQTRQWPAPGRRLNNTQAQEVNALYRVDNASADVMNNWTPGSDPVFMFVITAADYSEMDAWSNNSDAKAHGTFIALDGTGASIRHGANVRIRGASSRGFNPPPIRLEVPHDNPWHGYTDFNLNSKFAELQLIGSAILRDAGLQAAAGNQIQFRVNGINGAFGTSAPVFGSYLWLEPYNNEFLDKHLPSDSNGNIYKKVRGANAVGDWEYRNGNIAEYLDDGWSKSTNSNENDWSDLDNLMRVMNQTPAGPNFFSTVSQVANVDQWVRWFATMELLNSRETNLSNGTDDDYQMFAGVNDPRFILLPHDLDTILGQGEPTSSPTEPFFAAIRPGSESMPVLIPFFNDNEVVRRYYQAIKDLVETTFSAPRINALIDEVLGGYVSDGSRAAMKSFAAQRAAYALSIIPTQFAITQAPPVTSGYSRVTTPTGTVSGTANSLETVSIRVDGQIVTNWTARTGDWTSPALTLTPGINRILVQTFDGPNGTGNKLQETFVDIWYDDASVQSVSGAIAANTTWMAAAGPYRLTGDVTVNAAATLTIEPGTTVYLDGFKLTVNGRLNAQGTEYQQIRFTRTPGSTVVSGGLQFVNTAQDNLIRHAIIEHGGNTNGDGLIGLTGSKLTIENSTLDNAVRRRIRSTNSWLVARNNLFTDIQAVGSPSTTPDLSEHIWGSGILAGGQFIVEGNTFGLVAGTNDAIDFDGTTTGEPIPQFLNNTFRGGADDAIELEGKALVEGNVFRNFARGLSLSGFGQAHEHTVVRNTFNAVQRVLTLKQNARVDFVNNTVIGAAAGSIVFDAAQPPLGGTFAGNIFDSSPATFGPRPAGVNITVDYNILPDQANLGTGNIPAPARLIIDPLTGKATLDQGSPAIGSGVYGQDMGAGVRAGAIVVQEPAAQTASTSAFIGVGGPGIVAYRYRLDNGALGPETPVTTPITLSNLTPGPHTVTVIGKNVAGVWQQDTPGTATVSKTWTVNTSFTGLIINEVLAGNTAVPQGGLFPDLIELYNAGSQRIDLSGMSISDTSTNKTKYVFQQGAGIDPGQYLRLYADDLDFPGEIHLGFSLDAGGDGVYLYGTAGAGRPLIDSVVFGKQIDNLSIGRVGQDRHWALNLPTFGGANIEHATGRTSTLKINEWFSSGDIRIVEDYVELYNPDMLPVSLAGLYFTDEAVGDPLQYALPPLSFIPAGGYAVFTADDQTGADHLPLLLSSDFEHLGLFGAAGQAIDRVLYSSQTTDYSQGRNPDGTISYAFYRVPTPSVANPLQAAPQSSVLLPYNAPWRYNQTGNNLGTAWYGVNYNDNIAGWFGGTGVLFEEPNGLPAGVPAGTDLNVGIWTHYFRSSFTLNADPATAIVQLSMVIDDGAVVYINGNELRVNNSTVRANMPNGPIAFDTPSSTSRESTFYGPITIPASFLNSGVNRIAIEVHQSALDSSDVVMGAQVTLVVPPPDPLPQFSRIFDGLRITEMMYNAPGGPQFEYIELQNITGAPLDIGGVRLVNGVEYTFPAMTLGANQFVVVAADPNAFAARYGSGIDVVGPYLGELANGGENVTLALPAPYDAADLRFDYEDDWYPTTDGLGYSLEIASALARPSAWDARTGWRAGLSLLGTPGRATSAIAPVVITGSEVSVIEGATGTTNAVFTVSLSQASTQEVRVTYAAVPNTALSTSDFATAVGTLVFDPGETTKLMTVTVNGDTLSETDETFFLALNNPVNGVVLTTVVEGTILNDDPLQGLSVNDVDATETNAAGVNAVFTVRLAAASGQAVSVNYTTAAGTASATSDFTPLTGTLFFAPGQTMRMVTVPILADALAEQYETFTLNLSNATGAVITDGQGVVGITDDDLGANLSIGNVTVAEGDSGVTNAVFTVTLSQLSAQQVTVGFGTSAGTATSGTDFTPNSGTLTFAPGTTSQVVTVQVAGDTQPEAAETFLVTLSNPQGSALGKAQATGTITDNDPLPTVSISDATVIEGNTDTTNAVITLTLSAPSGQPTTVVYTLAPGTAGAADFSPAPGTVTFAAGVVSRTITVPVVGDRIDEPDETFTVNLGSPVGLTVQDSQATVTITDDDLPLNVGISDAQAAEGDAGTSPLVFTVTLSNASTEQVTLSYATAGDTATAGEDFNGASGSVTFAPGITEQRVTVFLRGDATIEPSETFFVNLSNIVGATLSRAQAVGTIADDDTPRNISIADLTESEGNSGFTEALVTLTLDGPSSKTVTVNFSTASGTAQTALDFIGRNGVATFSPGQISTVVTINLLGDTTIEPDEAFTVTLGSAQNGAILDGEATVTIADDDQLPTIRVANASVTEGNTGTVDMVFTVSLSGPRTQQVTVVFSTSNGNALAGVDYQANSGTITFEPGIISKPVTVLVNGDTASELNERFFLSLSSAIGGTASGGPASGTIQDDDGVPLPNITVGDLTITEENSGTTNAVFTATLSAASNQEVTLAFSTVDGTAIAGSDYTATTGTVAFQPGVTSQLFTVPVSGDLTVESTETFQLTLSSPVGATVQPQPVTATITDDDVANPHPWQNPRNNLDVNDNGSVEPLDALILINRLNATTDPLPIPPVGIVPPPYYDVNGDDVCAPLDVLIIINHLNAQSSAGLAAQAMSETLDDTVELTGYLPVPKLYVNEAVSARVPRLDDPAYKEREQRISQAAIVALDMAAESADDGLPSDREAQVSADDELEQILFELMQ